MASTSIAPLPLFPHISERPYHYRKSVPVRPSHYTTSSYTSVRDSYHVRPLSARGVSSFPTMGLFKEKEPKISDHSSNSPTVHGRFITTTLKKVKKQKSLAFVPSFHVSDVSSVSSGSDLSSCESSSPIFTKPPEVVKEVTMGVAAEEQVYRFQEGNSFRRRQGTHLHPYQHEASYMQAYDPILMDNDRYTECLLRRLTLNTPSFRDYNKKAPSHVLDLGCGEGRWVLEAAVAWKAYGTKVTGFDLMDMWEDHKLATDNVNFLRGNFIKYDLPFPDDTFDLVRMANLSLCIPYDKWEFVLGQVKRVLTRDGRLELIDDHIFFPYGKSPMRPVSPMSSSSTCRPFPSASSFDADEEDEAAGKESEFAGVDAEDIKASPTFIDSDSESLFPQDKPRLKLQSLPDPYTEWETQQASSKCLEILFGRMLEQKYRIHTRPSEFILDIMARVFGRRNVNKLHSMHLSLAPPGESGGREKEEDRASLRSSHSSSSSSLGNGKKVWMSIDWDRKKEPRSSGEMSSPPSPVPVAISTKAAARLGITPPASSLPESMSAKAACRLGISTQRPQLSTPRNQTPGLLLWPSTFIPMSPLELEMHACKHLHILLGCKVALAEFIATYKDENGHQFVGDQEFDDLIWDYECFRRQRFNWPSDVPEISLDDSSTDTAPKSSRTSNDLSQLIHSDSGSRPFGPVKYRRDELTHARTIRVYEAFKIENEC